MRIDRYSEKCLECGKGWFKEMSIYDDWDGKVTCSNCGKRVERHIYKLFRDISEEDKKLEIKQITGGLGEI